MFTLKGSSAFGSDHCKMSEPRRWRSGRPQPARCTPTGRTSARATSRPPKRPERIPEQIGAAAEAAEEVHLEIGWQLATDPESDPALFDPYHEQHAQAVERFQQITRREAERVERTTR
jgi:hypothetical protein